MDFFTHQARKNKFNIIINIISYVFLGIIIYYFIGDLKVFNIFQIFIFSIISFAVSMFISDKYKLSNNKIIKIIQKLVFINIIFAFVGIILYLFDINFISTIYADSDSDTEDNFVNEEEEKDKDKDVVHISTNTDENNEEFYNFKIKKNIVDNAIDKGKEILWTGFKDIGPNLGIGAAAGKVASEAFKATGGLPVVPRIAVVGSTALATAAGTKIGIELGKAVAKNLEIKSEIDSSNLELNAKDGIESPTEFDSGFIHSILEDSEIPLIIMLNGLNYLNYIELSLILALFSLLFRKFLYKLIKSFILNKKSKNLTANIKEVDKNKDNSSLNVSVNAVSINSDAVLNTMDKYTDYLLVFIFICLIWIKILNIYFSFYLTENIDSFVKVYDHIINNSFIFLILKLKSELNAQEIKNTLGKNFINRPQTNTKTKNKLLSNLTENTNNLKLIFYNLKLKTLLIIGIILFSIFLTFIYFAPLLINYLRIFEFILMDNYDY
jgi:hypothetical protein